MHELSASPHDRLMSAVAHATGNDPTAVELLQSVPIAQPALVRNALAHCGADTRTIVVTGTLDRRLVLIENDVEGVWTAADLSGLPHGSRTWPEWTKGHLTIAEKQSWLSYAEITSEGKRRLLRPRLLLASLYHPENFPLPRFPLAISDVARAARSTLLGTVELMDMQLGVSLENIIARVAALGVDILGVSVTFGQHDLLTRLLDEITSSDTSPLILAGGSLTARNEKILLERYPRLLVCRSAGEATIQDVLAYWHGDLEPDQIRGAGYRGAPRGDGTLAIGRVRRTATVTNRLQTDMWPELDLLDRTFQHRGVAQLETSRGCTNYCSFCPRGHKGQWAGATAEALPWLLDAMGEIFDQHPRISRTLYLVDEEFIGRGDDAVERALGVADMLAGAGFAWETSCRIDQVVRLDRDRAWHIERGDLWRALVARELRRCLFGVESGVTSILDRFNKETAAEQNVLAIRMLSALGVPTRFTYITFDHLMTEAELRATFAFQGRTDLLLRALPGMTVAEIVDGVRDEAFVAEHTTGHPFYSGISYMLVSMECLIGAAYTRKATDAGLTGDADHAMGRMNAEFADWRIGVLSHWSQLWIDRSFALDYTLKSLEKILDGQPRLVVRGLRSILKHAAYRLLGQLIDLLGALGILTSSPKELQVSCSTLAEALIRELRTDLAPAIAAVEASLSTDHLQLLRNVHTRWASTDGWQLINASDPCGT